MGRWTNFLGSGKAIGAGAVQTITFTGNDLPGSGMVALHFATQGAVAATTAIQHVMARLRIKADSTTIFDVNLAHYQAWMQRFSQANYTPSIVGSVQRWTVWLNMFDIVDDDLADVCQFPKGAVPTVELTTAATVTAGTVFAGWTITDQPAAYYPVLIGQQMNIPAAAVNQSFPITEPGMLRGYGLNTVGLDRTRLELSGFQYEYLPGVSYNAPTTGGDMFRDTNQAEDGIVTDNPCMHRLYNVQAGQGSSRIELTTLVAVWAGVTNELSTWAIRPQD